MPDRTLGGRRMLVVEDEYMPARELAAEVADAGATVVGPLGTVEDAITVIKVDEPVDGAILDVTLRGAIVLPAADLLLERGVPIVFTIGYDASAIPPRFAQVDRFEKPITIERVTRAIGRMSHD